MTPDSPRCGNCAFFTSAHPDQETGEIKGVCRFGSWPPERPATSWCRDHVPAGALHTARGHNAVKAAQHRAESRRTTTLNAGNEATARAGAAARERPVRPPIEIEVDDMDEATFRTILREILTEELGLQETPIGERWKGGELVLRPGREGVQEKRLPLEKFFHKIVMVRDKLRVLEQKVNGNAALSAEDKVTLQQYITGCYGSLTTFNVLFADDADRFVGQGEKD